jgi:VanZ family protein
MEHQKNMTRDPWLLVWMIVLIGVAGGSVFPNVSPPHVLDKGLHLLSYLLLTTVPLARIKKRETAFIIAGLMPVLGFLLEYLQKNINGREFSPEDMIANNIGAVAGIGLGIFFRLTRRFSRVQGGRNE